MRSCFRINNLTYCLVQVSSELKYCSPILTTKKNFVIISREQNFNTHSIWNSKACLVIDFNYQIKTGNTRFVTKIVMKRKPALSCKALSNSRLIFLSHFIYQYTIFIVVN